MKPQLVASTQEILAGHVERVTYHNAENGFCVLRTKVRGHRDIVTVLAKDTPEVLLVNNGAANRPVNSLQAFLAQHGKSPLIEAEPEH